MKSLNWYRVACVHYSGSCIADQMFGLNSGAMCWFQKSLWTKDIMAF